MFSKEYIEREITFMPLEDRPAIVLWAADIDYKTDSDHIVWLEGSSDSTIVINYGFLTAAGGRKTLASYSDTTLDISREAVSKFPMRMVTTLRWIWHCCLFTNETMRMYRWYRLPEQLEEAKDFHERVYGSRRSSEFIYGGS